MCRAIRVRRHLWSEELTRYKLSFLNFAHQCGLLSQLCQPYRAKTNAYVEGVIGAIRRECLEHVVVFNECRLCRVLSCYADYDHSTRPRP